MSLAQQTIRTMALSVVVAFLVGCSKASYVMRGQSVRINGVMETCYIRIAYTPVYTSGSRLLGHVCGTIDSFHLVYSDKVTNKNVIRIMDRVWQRVYQKPFLTVPVGGKMENGAIWHGTQTVSKRDSSYADALLYALYSHFENKPGSTYAFQPIYNLIKKKRS